MPVSSILLVALATAALADKPWEVVTSREGNFTVEMPAKPSPHVDSDGAGQGRQEADHRDHLRPA
jgi:hypothetical protein